MSVPHVRRVYVIASRQEAAEKRVVSAPAFLTSDLPVITGKNVVMPGWLERTAAMVHTRPELKFPKVRSRTACMTIVFDPSRRTALPDALPSAASAVAAGA